MKYIRGFDGLRAISILLVLITHLGIALVVKDHLFWRKIFTLLSGSTGVMIFFTISGFLITSLLINEKKNEGRINLKNFFIRRFLRLLPPLLIFFLAILVLMLCNLLPPNYPALLISFFYLYNFVPYTYYTVELGHTWSLGVEEQFYFFWPFVINRISRIKEGALFSILIIIICILWEILYPLPIYFNGKNHYLTSYFYMERWFIPACLPIMTGALAAMLLFKNHSYIEKTLSNKYLLLIVSLFLFSAQLYFPYLSIHLIHLFQPIGISILLLWIYFNQKSSLVNLLELKPVSFLGKISYGVYVYQGLFLTTAPIGKLAIQHFPLNILLVFITAILSYYLVEKKIMRFRNKFKSIK
jgi:peptidoglycan/LPS O-acetylase OafA/YrhL